MNPDLFQQFLQFQQFQQWAYAQQQQQLQSQQQSSVRQVPASGQTQETFAAARVQERVSGQTQTPQQWIQARPNIATEKPGLFAPISVIQLPDALTKKSAILAPTAKFCLTEQHRNPNNILAKVVLASDTHLDHTRSALKEGFNDAEFVHLQAKVKGAESRIFNPADRSVEFPHLSVSITGYQWFDDTCSTWKRVKGNRFSLRFLIFFFFEGQNYLYHIVHPIAVYSHPSQREPLRTMLGGGTPTPNGIVPVVEDIIPSQGPAFTENVACVTGNGFDAPAFVLFGDQVAQIETQKSTWIKVKTPRSTPGTYKVTVLCAGHTSLEDVHYTFLKSKGDYVAEDIKIDEGETLISAKANLEDTPMDDNDIYVPENPFEIDPYYSYGIEQQLGLMQTKENYVYSLSQTALHYAASFGKLEMTRNLVHQGRNIDAQDETGATPLYWCVWGGHVNATRLLLDLGAEPNIPNNSGEVPLHIACLLGNPQLVRLLLDHEADTEIRTSTGETAIFFAAAVGCSEAIQLLNSFNCKKGNRNTSGETALDWAHLGEQQECCFIDLEPSDEGHADCSEDEAIVVQDMEILPLLQRLAAMSMMSSGSIDSTTTSNSIPVTSISTDASPNTSPRETVGKLVENAGSPLDHSPPRPTAPYPPRNISPDKVPFKVGDMDPSTKARTFSVGSERRSPKLIEHRFPSPGAELCESPIIHPVAGNIPHQTQPQSKKKPQQEDFEQLELIGKGVVSGQVMLVRSKQTHEVYQMKVIEKSVIKDNIKAHTTVKERSVLPRLNHPFLAKLKFSFQNKQQLFFVEDYAKGGNLASHLTRETCFTIDRCRFYGAQIACGLRYLHANNITYRTLRTSNVLLTEEGNIIMTNFCLSKEGADKATPNPYTFDGKAQKQYLSPEFIQGLEYSNATDYWSLGIILHEMATGFYPFNLQSEENQRALYERILQEPLRIPETMNPDLADLLIQLLQKDPSCRLSDPQQLKSHPFFSSMDWVKLEKLELQPPFQPVIEELSDYDRDPFEEFTYVATETYCGRFTKSGQRIRSVTEPIPVVKPLLHEEFPFSETDSEDNHFADFTYCETDRVNETTETPLSGSTEILSTAEEEKRRSCEELKEFARTMQDKKNKPRKWTIDFSRAKSGARGLLGSRARAKSAAVFVNTVKT